MTSFQESLKSILSLEDRYPRAFLEAVAHTLKWEGEDAYDPSGGVTRFGISSRAHPDIDVSGLTLETAIEVYYRYYWTDVVKRIKSPPLQRKFFDLAVNTGQKTATRLIQRAVNRSIGVLDTIDVDGIYGPVTGGFVDHIPATILLPRLIMEACSYYAELAEWEMYQPYLQGWIRRAVDES